MATPRLARTSRTLLKASISSLEGNEICRSTLLRCTTARSSVSSGQLGQLGQLGQFEQLGQLGGQIDLSCGGVIRSRSGGAAAVSGDRNGSHGGLFWRSVEGFRSMGANRMNSSSGLSTTRSLAVGESAMKVKILDHVVLTVKDIEATCRFYSDVLGMEVVKFGASDGGTRVALAFGEQKINLHQVGKEFEPKAHRATAGSADLCFITDAPLDDMQKHIKNNGVSVLQGPVGRQGALGAIRSVYFRDPDLNLVEVSNYV